jgi:CDP-4-dehydro-6-deoxyglucose reductase, E1
MNFEYNDLKLGSVVLAKKANWINASKGVITKINDNIIKLLLINDFEDINYEADSVIINISEIQQILDSLSKEITEKLLRANIKSEVNNYYYLAHHTNPEFCEGDRVSYAGRVFGAEEMLNLTDATLDFWLTAGRFSEEFERKFAKKLGVRHSLLVNSGSSANLLAFSALTSPSLGERQIKPSDEVISVAAGFPTTIAPVVQYGAVPVFLDVVCDTYNINVSYLEEAISPKTKLIMLAHTLGNPFNLDVIMDFAKKHDLWVIEDNCDALGAKVLIDGEWKNTGTVGDFGTSSFYPPHHLTMGEGGAVYTNKSKLDKLAASFRDWGRDCWCSAGKDDTCGKRFKWQLGDLPEGYDHKYIYSHFGYNLKATDMQAAIGCVQLDRLENFIEQRIANFNFLFDSLKEFTDIFILPKATINTKPSWFGFPLTIRPDNTDIRNHLVNYLESANIQTRMLFGGNILRHPCFSQMKKNGSGYKVIGELKNTDKIMRDTFWLGVYPKLTFKVLQYVVDTIIKGIKTIPNSSFKEAI